jgi:hypothetical protein
MIVCQSAPPASAPEPRLTARSMLSAGTEVAGDVAAPRPRRDLDVLDQAREALGAP